VSIVGTTTMLRCFAGIPLLKSIRGKGRGFTNSVASQLTMLMLNWLAQSTPGIASRRSDSIPAPRWRAAIVKSQQIAATPNRMADK